MELDFVEDFKPYINKYSLPIALCAILKEWSSDKYDLFPTHR